jgi:hypothetical protein
LKNIRNNKGDPGQMATISECRYRWLRVPATNRKSLIEAYIRCAAPTPG